MKINKEFILKNLITICCVASVILLFLPFANATVEMESSFIDASSSTSVSGFDTIMGSNATLIAWIMLISPIVLVAMNYIKQLDKYKSILAIILPVLSIISAIITLFSAGASSEASAMGESASASVKLTPNIGFFLVIIAYIGTFIAGAITFYGLKLSKEGIAEFGNKLKEEGLSSVEQMKDLGNKASEKVSNMSSNIKHTEGNTTENNVSVASSNDLPTQKPVKKTNLNQVNDVLELIKQLSEMKEQGILTEEEFSEKKKELLSQI